MISSEAQNSYPLAITLVRCSTTSQVTDFIRLPHQLYYNDPHWVPVLWADEKKFHDARKNEALNYCEAIRYLAYRDNKPVGRIMGIIHHPYNNKHHEKTARFFALDCINDADTARILIGAIETWARERGMDKIIGPFGFSDKDPQGAKIEGFDFLPALGTPTNPPYLPALIEAAGYAKEIDCVSYQIPIPKTIPPKYQEVYQRIVKNPELRLVEFNRKAQLQPYILPVLKLMNETYQHIFGFYPLQETEMKNLAAQYLPVLDPEFVKVVVNSSGQLVAFVVGMPEMSAGIKKAGGKLFPFGFLHILRAMRSTKQLTLLLGAIKPAFRGVGISVLMGKSIIEAAQRRGMTIIDSHLILETNLRMRGECAKLDGQVYKRFRIYAKQL